MLSMFPPEIMKSSSFMNPGKPYIGHGLKFLLAFLLAFLYTFEVVFSLCFVFFVTEPEKNVYH